MNALKCRALAKLHECTLCRLVGQWVFFQSLSDLFRTGEYFDKTCYDDGQSPRNKASKIQKLAFQCLCSFSKGKETSRWWLIDEALHDHFSVTKMFFKNCHHFLSEELTLFPAVGSMRSETK